MLKFAELWRSLTSIWEQWFKRGVGYVLLFLSHYELLRPKRRNEILQKKVEAKTSSCLFLPLSLSLFLCVGCLCLWWKQFVSLQPCHAAAWLLLLFPPCLPFVVVFFFASEAIFWGKKEEKKASLRDLIVNTFSGLVHYVDIQASHKTLQQLLSE